MKISVILGVFQMSMGIVLKGCNALHFRKYVDFFFEFIPQLTLLLFFFGWMDTLIIGKWFQEKYVDMNWEPINWPHNPVTDGTVLPNNNQNFDAINLSPAVITTMIDIFLGGASNMIANP
jgi:vacuolar-type H+-ATPase subunit I/STV1